jgi:hypothetical protein
MIKCRISFTYFTPGYLSEKTGAITTRVSLAGDKRRVIEAIEERVECEDGSVRILHVQPLGNRMFRQAPMPRRFDYE